MKQGVRIWIAVLAVLVSSGVTWPAIAGTAARPVAGIAYRFLAPPRESAALGQATYGPIAAFLTRATGHKFVYVHLNSWLEYERWIWMNKGDLYFDGPHFAAWRMHNEGATLGPVVPQPQQWRLYTWRGNKAIRTVADTYGLRLCAPPAPNFGALWAAAMYTNPVRQPYFMDMHNWVKIYRAVVAHKCDVGVGPKTTLDVVDPHHTKIRILVRGPDYPNQAFTLSRSIPLALQGHIIEALLSPAGQAAMSKLRTRFANGHPLVSVAPNKYATVDRPLSAYWGATYQPIISRLETQGALEGADRRDRGPVGTARAMHGTGVVE